MINYSEENVFNKKVKKCLTFDPFKQRVDEYTKNKVELDQIKLNYFSCAEKCLNTYENLPLVVYHYEISCFCIKKCYDDSKIKIQL